MRWRSLELMAFRIQCRLYLWCPLNDLYCTGLQIQVRLTKRNHLILMFNYHLFCPVVHWEAMADCTEDILTSVRAGPALDIYKES